MKKRLTGAVRRFIRTAAGIPKDVAGLQRQIHEAKMLTTTALIRDMKARGLYDRLQDAEFKVFSQFGDDGIIQYLIHHLDLKPDVFIEFGVQDYTEATTRFLLMQNNWRGLVIDSSAAYIDAIRQESLYHLHDLTAVCAFVTRENINDLFTQHGFTGEIGLLHIDIDGNDYWVWDAIDAVDPKLVIMEYNSVFGPDHAITVPYDPGFHRSRAHHSDLYFGASLKALCLLAENKGYAFIGCNSAGNNAYFLRNDCTGPSQALTASEGYVESKYRESRDAQGRLSFLSGSQRLQAIRDMPVYHVERGETMIIGDLMGQAAVEG